MSNAWHRSGELPNGVFPAFVACSSGLLASHVASRWVTAMRTSTSSCHSICATSTYRYICLLMFRLDARASRTTESNLLLEGAREPGFVWMTLHDFAFLVCSQALAGWWAYVRDLIACDMPPWLWVLLHSCRASVTVF